MAQVISEVEQQAAALAWVKLENLIYKNPLIPSSPLRPSKRQVEFLAYDGEEEFFGGARGGGKLQPVDAKVLTPKGWRRFGDLKIGDSVIDPSTGGSCKVIQIFPQGEMQLYRITFDDGASCEVGMEHLWLYKPNANGRTHRPGTKKSVQREYAKEFLATEPPSSRLDTLKVGTTKEILALFRDGVSSRIPLTEPVLFTVNGRVGDSVDPYLAGVLLGDGALGSYRVTACDDEIRNMLLSRGFNALGQRRHTDGKPMEFGVKGDARKGIKAWLANHKLFGLLSYKKFIPAYVFTASIEYRLAFLQGLMDTDGTADDRGRCYFSSTSKKLADGVVELVRGLGGKARMRNRQTSYTYGGKKKKGLPSYTVRIWLRKTSSLFRIQRKRDRCLDRWNGGNELMRLVVSIEPSRVAETMCIKVSSPRGLYVTNDYIVTHNSDALLMAALMYSSVPGYSALILRRTYGDLVQDGGLVPRSKEWIKDKGVFREKSMSWEIPLPGGHSSTIRFGYFDADVDRGRYLGGAWQFCAFDEATWFKPSWYEFIFSCLRKADWVCKNCHESLYRDNFTSKEFKHKKPGACAAPEPIPMATNHLGMSIADVPIRVRSASNPGGISHDYFKRRFVVPGAPKRFVKSLMWDNPGLDKEEYEKQLNKLDPVTRAQYLNGDWEAFAGGRVQKQWFREFWVAQDRNGRPVYRWSNADVAGILHPNWPTCPYEGVPVDSTFNFITCDPASTEGDQYDFTVIGVFAVTQTNEIFILEIVRERMDIEKIVPRIAQLAEDYNALFVGIEDVAFQRGIIREGQRSLNVPVERLPTEGKSKLVRATPAIIRASEGQYFIPKDEPQGKFPWLEDFLAELIVFTGDEKQDSYNDQVDVFAYSALALLRHGLLSPSVIEPDAPTDMDMSDQECGIFMWDGGFGGFGQGGRVL